MTKIPKIPKLKKLVEVDLTQFVLKNLQTEHSLTELVRITYSNKIKYEHGYEQLILDLYEVLTNLVDDDKLSCREDQQELLNYYILKD